MADQIGTIRVDPDDDPTDPAARRVIRTDRDVELCWVLITGLASGRAGVDWRTRSDAEIGIGPTARFSGRRREWPRQSLADFAAVFHGYSTIPTPDPPRSSP